jgi:hypothetical protein
MNVSVQTTCSCSRRLTGQFTVKKVSDIAVPSRDVTNQTLPTPRESLVSDIPAIGTGMSVNFFHGVPFLHDRRLAT